MLRQRSEKKYFCKLIVLLKKLLTLWKQNKKPKAMTTYTTFEQEIKGNIFSLTVASGKYNYINISKLTNNPFRTAGKDYENYDKAVLAYKSPEMKSFILQVEMNLLMPKRSFIA